MTERVGWDEDGVTTWTVREYNWCPVCFERPTEDHLPICNGCNAERSNP